MTITGPQRAHPLAVILCHALALVTAVAPIPLIVVIMRFVSDVYQSILRHDDAVVPQSLLVAAVLGGTASAFAVVTAVVARSGLPVIPRWGPLLGLVLLGISSLLLLWLTAWSWGHEPDATPRQILASTTLDAMPWVAFGSYVGALTFGLVARRLTVRWRCIHLWGFGFFAPAVVSAASILLVSARLP